jgi:hypothetical protein
MDGKFMENAQSPDMASPRSYRFLMVLVIFLGVLIILGVIGLVVTAILRGGSGAKSSSAQSKPFSVTLDGGPDAQIIKTDVGDGKLVLHIRGAKGDEIVVLNAQSGSEIGRVKFGTAP